MTLFEILHRHGFKAPFAPAPGQPGTVNDARRRPIPFLIVPGVLDCTDRRVFSECVAEMLNAQAGVGSDREAA